MFRSDDVETKAGGDTGTAWDGHAKVVAGSDGLRVESESSSRDEEGATSYDRTSIDSGDTGLSSTIGADTDVEQASDFSIFSDGSSSDAPDHSAPTSSSESRSKGDSDGGNDGRETSSGDESDTGADETAGASASARNDGVRAENESYSRDEDGEVSYDRTSADTGASDAGFNLDVENVAKSFSGLSSSSDESGIFE